VCGSRVAILKYGRPLIRILLLSTLLILEKTSSVGGINKCDLRFVCVDAGSRSMAKEIVAMCNLVRSLYL
jgi:hypothetical protein